MPWCVVGVEPRNGDARPEKPPDVTYRQLLVPKAARSFIGQAVCGRGSTTNYKGNFGVPLCGAEYRRYTAL